MNNNRTPEESSAVERTIRESRTVEPRIRTRCPSCGNETLFVPEHGLLTCSWIQCREPAAINDSAKRESNAYREGFEAGAKEMREKCAKVAQDHDSFEGDDIESEINVLPLPTPTTKGGA